MPAPRSSRSKRLRLASHALVSSTPFLVRQLQETEFADVVRQKYDHVKPDCVYITNAAAAYVATVLPPAPMVLNAIDAWSFNEYQMSMTGSLARRVYGRRVVSSVERFERLMLPQFSSVIVVSEKDREWLLSRNPGVTIEVVSNGVDAKFFHPSDDPQCNDGSPPTVLFHGTMDYPPNIAAATFLIRQVMPSVWHRRPDTVVRLAGRSPSDRVRQLAGDRVVVTGAVPDIRSELWRTDISVFPLLSGSGVKNKVLEAAAAGKAIVATSSAVGDIAFTHGVHALVADDPQALADALVSVVDSPGRRHDMGAEARRLVKERHSWESVGKRCAQICEVAAYGVSTDSRPRRTT